MKNNLNNARKLYFNQSNNNITSSRDNLSITTLNKLNIYYQSTYEYIIREFGITLNKKIKIL